MTRHVVTIRPEGDETKAIYEQTIEDLDVGALIRAVNTRKRVRASRRKDRDGDKETPR